MHAKQLLHHGAVSLSLEVIILQEGGVGREETEEEKGEREGAK